MITTAWDLGGLADYERAEPAAVGAHARVPRPLPHQKPPLLHHLHRPPRQRRTWRLAEDLAQLGRDTDDPGTCPPDLDSVTVINDWRPIHHGHRDDGERELAAAIAERHRQQARSKINDRRAA